MLESDRGVLKTLINYLNYLKKKTIYIDFESSISAWHSEATQTLASAGSIRVHAKTKTLTKASSSTGITILIACSCL